VIDRFGETGKLHFVVEHKAAKGFGRARRSRFFCFVTDQSRIALIASLSLPEPISTLP